MNLCIRFRKMYLGHIFMVNLPRIEIAHLFKTVLWDRKQGRASISKTTNTTFRYIEYEDIEKKNSLKLGYLQHNVCW